MYPRRTRSSATLKINSNTLINKNTTFTSDYKVLTNQSFYDYRNYPKEPEQSILPHRSHLHFNYSRSKEQRQQ